MEYIRRIESGECIFCTLPQENADEKNYILYRGPKCFILLNIYPYNTGHIMISPYRHTSCLSTLDETEMSELNRLTQKSIEIMRQQLAPEGFNTGVNIGKAGGAGFEEHVHLHIVPRWNGDTNFMPVLGATKVHPEHLQATHNKLLPHFQNIES